MHIKMKKDSILTKMAERKRILLCLAHMSGNEQKYIKEAFDTNWVVPLGPNVNAFEENLETFLGCDSHVAALSAGTAAIHLGLVMLGVGKGDEVICQSFTFSASANPIVYQGATPVFVDSEPGSWNISPELLEEAIRDRMAKTGKKPKAIVAVHLYGMPAQLDEILEVAARFDIPVLEDAAEALGSEYNGRQCGTFGQFGALSFNGNKMITTSGGGAIVCHSADDKKRATFFATQAREPFPYYQHEHIGYNYRMSNICAGIGRGQMTVVAEHIAHHRHTASLYAKLLADVDGVMLHTNPSAKQHSNFWLNTITLDGSMFSLDCDTLRRRLDEKGIESRLLWKPLHLQPVFSGCPAYVNGVSEELFGKGLCLPSGPMVSDDDLEYIAGEIKACCTKK